MASKVPESEIVPAADVSDTASDTGSNGDASEYEDPINDGDEPVAEEAKTTKTAAKTKTVKVADDVDNVTDKISQMELGGKKDQKLRGLMYATWIAYERDSEVKAYVEKLKEEHKVSGNDLTKRKQEEANRKLAPFEEELRKDVLPKVVVDSKQRGSYADYMKTNCPDLLARMKESLLA